MTQELDLKALRKVAEAATTGPWRADDEHGNMAGATPAWCVSRTNETGDYLGDLAWMPQDVNGRGKPNATHIATFDPPTILALLSRLEQAEESARLVDDMLRAVLEAFGSGPETDPIIKARQIVARLEQAEQAVGRVREFSRTMLVPHGQGVVVAARVKEALDRALDGDGRG